MTRLEALRDLTLSEHQVALGRENIARQREVILTLERKGQDAARAQQTLAQIESRQMLYLANRNRLVDEYLDTPDI